MGLPLEARIPGFWDGTVPIISGTCTNVVCSFLPQCRTEGPVLDSECGTCTYHVIGRQERPEYGSRSRIGPIGQDFRDLRAYLHSCTTDGPNRSVSYTGYAYAISPMGKDIIVSF